MLTAVMRSTHFVIFPKHASAGAARQGRLRYLCTTILLCHALLGCAGAADAQQPAVASNTVAPTTAPTEPPRRYVLHLPGIGGLMRIDRHMVARLRQGGVDAAGNQNLHLTRHHPGILALR